MTFAAQRARAEIADWLGDAKTIFSRARVGSPAKAVYEERITVLTEVLKIIDHEIKREIDDLHENER